MNPVPLRAPDPRLGALASAALALAVVAAALAALDVSTAAGQEESPCIVTHEKQAAPKQVLLGETVQITLSASAACPPVAFHFVLVLDASGTMAGTKNGAMRQAARTLVEQLALDGHASTRVGVVAFAGEAGALCELTNDASRALACIQSVDAAGPADIAAGIAEGIAALGRGRDAADDPANVREVLLIMSDGNNDAGCTPVLEEAAKAKGTGVLVVSVCIGQDCDRSCMRRAATSPRYFFEDPEPFALGAVLDRITEAVNVDLRRATITDRLPDNMRYIPTGSDPDVEWDPTTRTARWTTSPEGSSVTHTLRVQPLAAGEWPTNVEARGELLDGRNRPRTFVFDVPTISVLDPGVEPTPGPLHRALLVPFALVDRR